MNTGIRASRDNIIETIISTVDEFGEMFLIGVLFVTAFLSFLSIINNASSRLHQTDFSDAIHSEAFSELRQYSSSDLSTQ